MTEEKQIIITVTDNNRNVEIINLNYTQVAAVLFAAWVSVLREHGFSHLRIIKISIKGIYNLRNMKLTGEK